MAGDPCRVSRLIAARKDKRRLATLAKNRKKARNTTATHGGRVAGHSSCFIKAQHGGGGWKKEQDKGQKSHLLLDYVHARSASLRHHFGRFVECATDMKSFDMCCFRCVVHMAERHLLNSMQNNLISASDDV